MENYLKILQTAELFSGIEPTDIMDILRCSGSETADYAPGEYIFHADSPVSKIGLALSGRAHMISEDYWGNKFILTEIAAGQIFGEVNALTPAEPVLFSVVAQSEVRVLYISIGCMTTVCKSSCARHLRMIQNLLAIVSRKNIEYLQKFEHMSRRSTREKLLSYFSEQAKKHHSAAFDVSFNRQQLADYLSVDRSAMSSELSRMSRDGLIRYDHNHFELI